MRGRKHFPRVVFSAQRSSLFVRPLLRPPVGISNPGDDAEHETDHDSPGTRAEEVGIDQPPESASDDQRGQQLGSDANRLSQACVERVIRRGHDVVSTMRGARNDAARPLHRSSMRPARDINAPFKQNRLANVKDKRRRRGARHGASCAGRSGPETTRRAGDAEDLQADAPVVIWRVSRMMC